MGEGLSLHAALEQGGRLLNSFPLTGSQLGQVRAGPEQRHPNPKEREIQVAEPFGALKALTIPKD